MICHSSENEDACSGFELAINGCLGVFLKLLDGDPHIKLDIVSKEVVIKPTANAADSNESNMTDKKMKKLKQSVSQGLTRKLKSCSIPVFQEVNFTFPCRNTFDYKTAYIPGDFIAYGLFDKLHIFS